MSEDLSPADRATIENFCRELGFALRRIVGSQPPTPFSPTDLPSPVQPGGGTQPSPQTQGE